MLSVTGLAGLVVAGANCGSSGGGGAGGTGGVAGKGGAGGTGGTGGAHDGGTGGTGGTGGAHDAATDALGSSISFTFNTDAEAFMLDTFASTSPLNLAASTPDGGAGPTLAFDGTTGMPAPGSLKITATYTDYDQMVTVMRDFTGNLSGKTLTAQVILGGTAGSGDGGASDGGGTASSSFSGNVRLFAMSAPPPLSTTSGYAESVPTGLTDNNWHTLTFDLVHPNFTAAFDPSMVTQIGIKILSPQPVAADAANPPFGTPESIIIHFDTLVSN